MKPPSVLCAVGLLSSIGLLGGASQASIVTITADTSGDITATAVAPFDLGLTSTPVLYQLGTVNVPSNASSGSLVWNVSIDGVTRQLAQSVILDGDSVAIGDSAPVNYELPNWVSWDVYAIGLTVFGSTAEVYGSFVDCCGAPPIPEPSTLLVWFGLGAAGLIAAWRRRKRAA